MDAREQRVCTDAVSLEAPGALGSAEPQLMSQFGVTQSVFRPLLLPTASFSRERERDTVQTRSPRKVSRTQNPERSTLLLCVPGIPVVQGVLKMEGLGVSPGNTGW